MRSMVVAIKMTVVLTLDRDSVSNRDGWPGLRFVPRKADGSLIYQNGSPVRIVPDSSEL